MATLRQRAASIAAAGACALALPAAGTVADGGWTFRVLLDGKPIGQHRFSSVAAGDGAGHTMLSEAAFTVRFLGVTLYRYQHRAVERWRDGCLQALSADTDDNGQRTSVSAGAQGDRFEVSTPQPQSARGCVLSFAYWHPALRTQQRLLNAQTGRIEPVRIDALGERTLELGERRIPATQWRISGLPEPIDVWYSAQGEWVGLDTRVDGGRMLSYRRL